jgi:hypothetical protein
MLSLAILVSLVKPRNPRELCRLYPIGIDCAIIIKILMPNMLHRDMGTVLDVECGCAEPLVSLFVSNIAF